MKWPAAGGAAPAGGEELHAPFPNASPAGGGGGATRRGGARPVRTPPGSEAGREPGPAARVEAVGWESVAERLDADGYAILASTLPPAACDALAGLYEREAPFRSRVVMAPRNFGRGEYKYFAYPLPPPVAALRTALYPPLAAIANRWNVALRIETRYPPDHQSYLDRCHRAGQTRPTPLMLRYGEGDYNRLHQDLYGEHVFPMQATILLSAPGRDFTGGEFILVEQRPRMQSRAEVVPLAQGDAVIFPVRQRPVQGTRGFHRANLRHGVSRLRTGRRLALGVIFHDAR